MAEPTGEITGASKWLNADTISTLINLAPMIPALIQGNQAMDQKRKAEEMRRNLGPRVNYTIPESAKRALGVAEDLARPREMAGQNLMQYMLEQERSKTLAQAMRGLGSSQDVAALAAQQAEIGQAGQLQLGATAAQDYTRRQQALGTALGTMAGYEDMVTADKQLDWAQRAKAAVDMETAYRKNQADALRGGVTTFMGAATGFLGSKTGQDLLSKIGGGQVPTPSDGQVPTPSVDPLPFSITTQPSMNNPAARMYGDFFGMGGMRGKNPSIWDYYQPIVPQNPSGYVGSNFNSGFFNNPDSDLNNPIY
jgi:hypothetical protein